MQLESIFCSWHIYLGSATGATRWPVMTAKASCLSILSTYAMSRIQRWTVTQVSHEYLPTSPRVVTAASPAMAMSVLRGLSAPPGKLSSDWLILLILSSHWLINQGYQWGQGLRQGLWWRPADWAGHRGRHRHPWGRETQPRQPRMQSTTCLQRREKQNCWA